jgi:hypothetical protein
MSNYHALTRHPITGKIQQASWLDDSFGHHIYGVRFPGDETIYPGKDCTEVSSYDAAAEIERLRAALRQLAEIDKIENGFIRIKEVIHYTKFMARAALGEKTDD